MRLFKRVITPAALALTALTGCTTLHPSAGVNQEHPEATAAEVFVIRTLCHAAIAIPDKDGRYIEWGFGDGVYMTHTGFAKGFRGLILVPLGLFGRVTGGALIRTEFVSSNYAQSFLASREQIALLRDRLQMQYDAGDRTGEEDVYRTANSNYSVWWYNCQNWVAEHVRDLDGSVSKFRLVPRWGKWRIRVPSESAKTVKALRTVGQNAPVNK